MRKCLSYKRNLLIIIFLLCAQIGFAQLYTFSNSGLIQMNLEKVSANLRDIPEKPPTAAELKGPRPVHDNPSLERPLIVNPNSGNTIGKTDAALQKEYNKTESHSPFNLLSNWDGLTAAVEPSDNNIAVGPNNVMQMTNNDVSTYIRIWDKAGTVLVANKLVSDITGIVDYGDPNVLYDQAADRYLFVVLYSREAKKLVVAVSQSPDPTGAYYVYSFNTPGGFPDYPKIGVWLNAYYITTNSSAPAIFALNRSALLNGQSGSFVQMFSLSKFPSLGFQSASPISQTGSTLPSASLPASVIRVADNAWGKTVGPDHLEIFNLHVDWVNPRNSTISGPFNLPILDYNSNLCGFNSGGCIPQPNSTIKLDPLSNVIMDKVQYRNLGSYESVVCSHVANADGNGNAGVRWYELRRSTGGWYVYQQGTYAPSADGRFMSSITINQNGDIALGYNISSTTVYPGIGITGRNNCDALNNMTVPETIVKAGAAANNSNRYGDYNGMVTDPVDGSFWFTGNYNPTAYWATNVVHFNLQACPVAPTELSSVKSLVTENKKKFNVIPNPASEHIVISLNENTSEKILIRIYDATGLKWVEKTVFANPGINSFEIDTHVLIAGSYLITMLAQDKTETQKLIIIK